MHGKALGLIAAALLAALVAVPVAAQPAGLPADVTRALAADGRFVGAAGLTAAVDTTEWTLASDISAGEPPRLERAPSPAQVTAHGGAAWSALGSDGAGNGAIDGPSFQVSVMAISGNDLYVGGPFANAAGIPEADFLARWNGSTWSAVGPDGDGSSALNGSVHALAISGSNIYVGGTFSDASGIAAADFVALWNGSFWSALGSNGEFDGALNNSVASLALSGSDLYVGGFFTDVAGIATADYVARWSGSGWFALGSGGALNGSVNALAVSGSNVYLGGYFTNASSIAAADFVALWNGSSWSDVGGGLNSGVRALVVDGTNLYAGGDFTDAGGQAPADFVARWNGSSWSALGSNGSGNGALGSTVFALAVSGSEVFAGGQFTNAANLATADRVAHFDGAGWAALGSNGSGDGALNSVVRSLALSSSELFVGGEFTNAAGTATADRIAAFGPLASYQPDGRIRKGSGAYVGNNIYNSTGIDQTRQGTKSPGDTMTFTITIQNDGSVDDRFMVDANGTPVTGYVVRYFRGSTEITAAVVAGTYRTSLLAPAAKFVITATVKVKAAAAAGSSVTRLVTMSSVADPAAADAVRFIGKRG